MHLLVIEDRPGIAVRSAEALEQAGHQVQRCFDDRTSSFPCRALTGGCPLEGGVPIDLVVDVRCGTGAQATAGEAGGTCALRRDVPVLVDGRTDPFPGWSAVRREDEDLVPACERAIADHDRARAARLEAEVDRMIGPNRANQSDQSDLGSSVTVERTKVGTSIQVRVPRELTPQQAGRIATRIHAVERDRGAVHRVLDIGVAAAEGVDAPAGA